MNKKIDSAYPALSVIPEPKKIVQTEARFYLPPQLVVSTENGKPEDYLRIFNRLTSELNALGAKVSFRTGARNSAIQGLALTLRNANTPEKKPGSENGLKESNRGQESYSLQIGPEGIRITALNMTGLFYGVMTLIQLAVKQGKNYYFPGVQIEDWPDLAMRGAHLYMRSRFFKYEYVENFIREISKYKMNTLLLEYQLNIRYEKHPILNGPGVWTKDQIKGLLKLAEENFLTVIPLLQCLGHVEDILRYPEYKHLREGENIWSQFCPTNPQVIEFYKELCDEILPFHEGPGYFHIGGDESYYLGSCENCRKVVAEKGKDGLYVDYVNKICAYLKSRGKTPMLWDDMLAEYPHQINQLCPEAVLCYWDYTPSDHETPFLLFRNQGYYCHRSTWENRKWKGFKIPNRRIKDLATMPKAMFNTYRKYLENSAFPEYLSRYPFYRFFRDQGFKTIGAPATAGGEANYYHVNHRLRLDNVVGMIGTVQKSKGEGVIITSWFSGGLTMHVAYHPLLATAEHAWFYNGVSEEELNRKFVERFFGTDADAITWVMFQLKDIPSLCFNLEDHDADTLNALGEFCVTGSLKELMDRRIEKFEQNPDIVETLRTNQKILGDAQQGLAILEANKHKVKRNRPEYNRLILGAKLDIHKTSQVLLFHAVESFLRKNKNFQSLSSKELFKELQKHKSAIDALKKNVQIVFADVLQPSAVKDYNAILFEGEEAKGKEYLARLSGN